MPVHASAAGKLLLAHLTNEAVEYWLSRPLPAYTTKTLSNAVKLRAELASIKRRRWAEDKGETAPSILAYAAPVVARDGRVVAAVSIPFLAGTPADQAEAVKAASVRSARLMSKAIPD